MSALAGLDLDSRANTFTVNALGTYALRASYYDKSNRVSLTMGAVSSGEELPAAATLNTATTLNGSTITKNVQVPVAWTSYGGGSYLATVNLPVDADNELCYIGQKSGWIFKSYDTVLEAAVSAAAVNGEGVSVVPEGNAWGRVNADGSAVVSQRFRISGYVSPPPTHTVTVRAWDVNTDSAVNYAGSEQTAVDYQFANGQSVYIPIPPVTSESCVGVRETAGLDASALTLENGALAFRMPDGDVEITLNYKPIVNMISVVLSGVPQARSPQPRSSRT